VGVPETHTPQGELVIGDIVHGAAMNCMVIPYDDPDGWFFKQFTSSSQMEDFALKHNLVMKRKDDGNPRS
jgi:hypothetical protein